MELSYNKVLCSLLALCLVFVAVSAKPIPVSDINPQTVMISELFRHGARYTLYNLFDEPDVKANNGMLSATGMRQHYMLGKSVRKAYPNLFADEYDHNQISIVSTHVPRVVESAQSHFLGMYDLMAGQKLTVNKEEFLSPPFNQNQKDKVVIKDMPFALNGGYRPVPIFALDAATDRLLMDKLSLCCPAANKLQLKEIAHITPRFDAASKSLSDDIIKLGLDPKKMVKHESWSGVDLGKLYDNAKAHLFMYGKHKKPITKEIFDRLELVYSVDFFSHWKNDDVSKLWTHKLILSIIDAFRTKINDPTSKLTYNAYSGHDSTISPFLKATGMNSFECLLKELETGVVDPKCHHSIEYASNIIWELNTVQDPNDKTKTDYLVRMLYNGTLMYACQDAFKKGYIKAEPKYEGYCTFDEFVEASKSVFELGDRYDEVCEGKKIEESIAVNLGHMKSMLAK